MQKLQKRLSIWAVIVAGLLLIPLLAMQFTTGVNWTPSDFIFMGLLLFGSAFAYETVARHGRATVYRAAVGVTCLAALLLMWVNAAVGLIGDGPVNLLYLGVPVVLLVGAWLARCRPIGMMWTLAAAASVQMLIPILALLVWQPPFDPGVPEVFALNAGFALLFGVAALLFRHAAQTESL